MGNYRSITPHRMPTGNAEGYKQNLEALAAAGIRPRAMAADTYGPCFEAFEVARAHGLEAVAIYRPTTEGQRVKSAQWNNGYEYQWNVPGNGYQLDVEYAITNHIWAHGKQMEDIPEWVPETWFQWWNEIDHERLEYAAQVALGLAKYGVAHNLHFSFFGFNAGEPEPADWLKPAIGEFLQHAAQHRDHVAVSLHEYSNNPDISYRQGDMIGRFQYLIDACNQIGVDFTKLRIFVTEYGHGKDASPAVMPDSYIPAIDHAAALYPDNVYLVAPWVISSQDNWGGEKLAGKVRESFNHAVVQAISTGEEDPDGPAKPPPTEPPTQPPAATIDEAMIQYANAMFATGQVMSLNKDAALQKPMYPQGFSPIADEDRREYDGIRYGVQLARTTIDDRVRVYYAPVDGWDDVLFTEGVLIDDEVIGQTLPPEPPTRPFAIRAWPCDRSYRMTQGWGARKEYYAQFGWSGGHEGVDFGVPLGMPYFAVDGGVVERVTDKLTNGQPSNYGWYVIIRHADGFRTLYGHARADVPVRSGQQVRAGDTIAYSGNTGRSTGPHLHFSILRDGVNNMPVFPPGYIDPTPYLWPPSVERVDLRPYFLGHDARIQWVLTNEWGSGEDLQRQDTATGWRLVKNRNAEYFRFTERGGRAMIGRTLDTSMGGGRVYTLHDEGHDESAWCPAEMAAGEVYTRSPVVTVYEESSCRIVSQNQSISNIRFLGRLDRFNNREWVEKNDLPLIELDDCAILQWESMAGDPLEQYVGSVDRGYFAGWKRQHNDPNSPGWSVITEINRDRAPLVPRAVPCGIKV